MHMKRREFNSYLQRSALSLALLPWMQAIAAPAERDRPWRVNPFALGVASGRPRPDAVVLWTRLLVDEQDRAVAGNDAIDVTVEVFADSALKQRVHLAKITTDASRGHSVHLLVQSLQPSTDYWYRFRQGDATSSVGHTRTTPALQADVAMLRIALSSCQHYEAGLFVAHQEIAQQDLDFVLFVGDYIYESSNAQYTTRKHITEEPKTLEQYRARYALYKQDPMLQASHAAHPWVLMWDDHEVVNDYANQVDMKNTPVPEFLARRAAGYQAYFEHQPVLLGPDPKSPQRASMRLHDQFAWGRLADIWTLDNRQFRSPLACPDPVRGGGRMVTQCDALSDPTRSMFGFEQERWLDKGLKASKRTWKLLAQGTQMSSTSIPGPTGRAYWNEAWDGYPEARKRLLQSLADNQIKNVVSLGGDVHMNIAANLRPVPNDPNSPLVASEFVTTSVTSRGMGEKALGIVRDNNPDLIHARGDERGYSLISVTPAHVRCDFRTTAMPAGSEASFKTQASFVVEKGNPAVKPV